MGKNKPLKQIFERDKIFFQNLNNTGVVTPKHYKDAGVSSSRIKAYVKAGLIEKTPKENGGDFGYKATVEGKKFAEKQWGIKRSESYVFQSLNHDKKLEEEYYNIDHSVYEWKTESQARDMFRDRIEEIRKEDYERAVKIERMWENKEISMPDAIVIERGTERIIAIEIITNNYGEEQLQAKETFVEVMQIDYKPVRA